jgi:hypothetical protein
MVSIPDDRGIADTMQSVILSLRDDTDLVNHIGSSDRIYPAKRAEQRDDPVAILVERVNTMSTKTGPEMYRTFHVVQVKLVMTETELKDRDPLYPDVVCDRIARVMQTAFPEGSIPRGRDDAGGMDIPNDDATVRRQWPQRFRVLAFTDH